MNVPREPEVSGWALGGITFAACVLTIVGAFQIIGGLAAIINDDFFINVQNYSFDIDTTGWGWIHFLLGILLVITGFGLFGRAAWAGVTAIFLASLSAVVNFFSIPYYPAWSILVIALDVWVIWALTRPGAVRTYS
jgi:hypothetical protein